MESTALDQEQVTIGSVNNLIENELTLDSFLRVAKGESGVIHVPNFYPVDVAKDVVRKVIGHEDLGYYTKKYTSSVGRVCMPHIDSEWDKKLTEKYHNEAEKNIHKLRSLFYPHITPVDHIRLLLQEMWPAGANIQQTYGHKCFVGTFRVFKPETSTFYPHHDRIDEETDAPEISGLINQLVANIYLTAPDEGGDLELWLRDPTDDERAQIRDVEGLLREEVEPPVITIHTQPGDLTVFSTRLLHAVTPCKDNYRVGMAAFIGVYGEDKPLTYWS